MIQWYAQVVIDEDVIDAEKARYELAEAALKYKIDKARLQKQLDDAVAANASAAFRQQLQDAMGDLGADPTAAGAVALDLLSTYRAGKVWSNTVWPDTVPNKDEFHLDAQAAAAEKFAIAHPEVDNHDLYCHWLALAAGWRNNRLGGVCCAVTKTLEAVYVAINHNMEEGTRSASKSCVTYVDSFDRENFTKATLTDMIAAGCLHDEVVNYIKPLLDMSDAHFKVFADGMFPAAAADTDCQLLQTVLGTAKAMQMFKTAVAAVPDDSTVTFINDSVERMLDMTMGIGVLAGMGSNAFVDAMENFVDDPFFTNLKPLVIARAVLARQLPKDGPSNKFKHAYKLLVPLVNKCVKLHADLVARLHDIADVFGPIVDQIELALNACKFLGDRRIVYVSDPVSDGTRKRGKDLHCEIKLYLHLRDECKLTHEQLRQLTFCISKPTCGSCTAYFFAFIHKDARPRILTSCDEVFATKTFLATDAAVQEAYRNVWRAQ